MVAISEKGEAFMWGDGIKVPTTLGGKKNIIIIINK